MEILGRKPVLEYLRSLDTGAGIELFVSKSAHGKIIDEIVAAAKRIGARAELVEKAHFARHPSSTHQGVMLVSRRKRETVTDAEFVAEVSARGGVLVLLDHLTDPHNVGAIIRTVEALGGDGVALTRHGTAEVNATVVKASAGATAHLRVITTPNAAHFIELARERGFSIVGTAADGTIGLDELPGLRPLVIVIGSEGEGMRRLTEERCDHIVAIPLRGMVASLNASVAAAIVLHEALKE
ncbi:MAG TPA: 23S rRNA (guanosine(2251)-2'-O)-methyltransferase RlmB [Spirochaetota bacterium]|nr:23S rRNA (guanosine(2251)-2'-O)-methyltransferase RlmB [Spirochaetota bacterium]HPU87541.1 23S rRNA (guanosine(2251)-2'-O)-methyltransferase RlmB [Spirochaetota bacterium]